MIFPIINLPMINTDKLNAVTRELNAESDALGAMLVTLNDHLKQFNIGLACWRKCGANQYSVGYGQYEGRWGLLLRDENDGTIWHYNNAPRWFRVGAVSHLKPLIEENLVATVEAAVLKIRKKVALMREIIGNTPADPTTAVKGFDNQ